MRWRDIETLTPNGCENMENNIADELARNGMTLEEKNKHLWTPFSVLEDIGLSFEDKKKEDGYLSIRAIFPEILRPRLDLVRTRVLLNLPRTHLRMAVTGITGHYILGNTRRLGLPYNDSLQKLPQRGRGRNYIASPSFLSSPRGPSC
ncbi:hypothetical protein EVAR_73827_1 [Eumeta japonica]|uniref:Uncharacterized protein n=1 Tax=Eumeta variegata TaxID=151549 RepID=A0A4C1T165_EUMVA|nr:hypothetical protein EVAR_73827_1 [Eumeta japonica]